MVIRGRAPLRVSFGGGGTDVAPFCEEQGGAIIGSTINKYAYCSIVPREDDQIIVHSLDFDMTVKYNTRENFVYDGKLDLVKAALKAMEIDRGCEVYLQCDAPPGSGLGTSSTVMVGASDCYGPVEGRGNGRLSSGRPGLSGRAGGSEDCRRLSGSVCSYLWRF